MFLKKPQSNMSNEIHTRALELLKLGFSVIPISKEKEPTLKAWKQYQTQRATEQEAEGLFSRAYGLGIVCGNISGGLEVIDVDTKHDTTGSLWSELQELIKDQLPGLLDRLVIAQTVSGGYHLYYKCETIEKNKKLSNRIDHKTLIETRGEGGYVAAPPTPGYKYLQGDVYKVPTITPQEREKLFTVCRSFNEIPEEEERPSLVTRTTWEGLSPWEDYNQRGDVIGLLQRHGWKVVKETGERIYLLRPGETDSRYSGNFHTRLRVLWVFSSSTEFRTDKGYSPYQVYTLLECNGDNKRATRELLDQGYGERYQRPERGAYTETETREEPTSEEIEEFKDLLVPLTRDKIREDLKKEKANLPTGFYLRDGDRELELKIPSGQLTIIAGRTSHRKTGTMLNLCKEVSDRIKDQGGRILFLSYEESSTNIQLKLFNVIANLSNLDNTGQMDNKEYLKAYYRGEIQGSKEFKEAEERFYTEYIDTGRIVVKYCNYKDKKLARAVRYLANQESYSAIFIDYIQLIRTEENSKKSRQEQLFNICEELREVAIQTRIPLIFGAQFNREVEARTDLDSNKLREAGDIEQTANLVLGLWDNNFNPEGEKVKTKPGVTPPQRESTLYIEVLKGRDIGIGWRETFGYNPPTGAIAVNDRGSKKEKTYEDYLGLTKKPTLQ